jgi:hypothetical protein
MRRCEGSRVPTCAFERERRRGRLTEELAAAVQVVSCRDSVFCVAVNTPPIVLGDCRRLQVAPYNTYYERLEAHLAAAHIRTAPNCWCALSPLRPCSPRYVERPLPLPLLLRSQHLKESFPRLPLLLRSQHL